LGESTKPTESDQIVPNIFSYKNPTYENDRVVMHDYVQMWLVDEEWWITITMCCCVSECQWKWANYNTLKDFYSTAVMQLKHALLRTKIAKLLKVFQVVQLKCGS